MKTCKYCNNPNITQFSSYKYYDIFECNSCKLWFWKSIEECCRNPQNRIVSQHIDYNIFQIRVQCDNCGGCLNMRKPLNHAKYSNMVKDKFSLERHNNWKQSKTSESDYIYLISKTLKFANSNYTKYLNNLQSIYWKNIRMKALERDNYLCQSCMVVPAEEVHHITYINIGQEKIEDLISYCSKCHSDFHGK